MPDDSKVVPLRRPKNTKISHEDAINKVLAAGVSKLVIIGENKDGSGITVFHNGLNNAELVFMTEYAKLAILIGDE